MGAERALSETTTAQASFSPAAPEIGEPLAPLTDVPLEITVRLGRARLTLGELLKLRAGTVITLEQEVGEPAEILVGDKVVALGQMVVVGQELGVRVVETAPEIGQA
ncbi:MAG: FliM/FliN family flagellar motor switch protein [Bacteroidota bacterium]